MRSSTRPALRFPERQSAAVPAALTAEDRFPAIPRWLVATCALLWIVVGLFGREPFKPDEAYTVGLVKSIVDTGDWVVPSLAGEPFMEKPPLFFGVAALFAKLLPGLPLHEAARCAVLLFVGIGLLAIGRCARAVYGAGCGRLAVLLTLATLGTVVRMHQLITDTALFAGMALALLGLVRAPQAPARGGAQLGAGLAIAFLSKGLLGPGLIVCSALALLAHAPWRARVLRKTAVVALLVALPPAVAWLVALEIRAPEALHVWLWDNNLGRFFGLNDLGPKQDLLFYARTLSWYALPCWPLALWGWVHGRRADAPEAERLGRVPPVLFLAVGIAVLSLASDGRELYALVLVPAFAVLAVGGLLRLPRKWEQGMAWAVAAFTVLLSALLFAAWAAAMLSPELTSRLPASLALPAMVAPSVTAMAAYVCTAAALLGMLATLRRGTLGALPLAGAAGSGLLWASLMLPWGGYLDALKGYRSVALALHTHLPAVDCIASEGLGEGERALLDYFIGLRTWRVEAGSAAQACDVLLVQSRRDMPHHPGPPWLLWWEGARPGSDTSVLQMYVQLPGEALLPALLPQ